MFLALRSCAVLCCVGRGAHGIVSRVGSQQIEPELIGFDKLVVLGAGRFGCFSPSGAGTFAGCFFTVAQHDCGDRCHDVSLTHELARMGSEQTDSDGDTLVAKIWQSVRL